MGREPGRKGAGLKAGGPRGRSQGQAAAQAGPVDVELWDHTPHRMGVPVSQCQRELLVVQRGGTERAPWITHTPHNAVSGRNT